MTALGEKILFLHFPRTGGTHLGELLERAGVVVRQDGDAHRIPTGHGQTPVVVLRQPGQWLASYHAFRMRGGRACAPEVDPYIQAGLENTLSQLPTGAVDAVYAKYALTLPGTLCACYERLGASLGRILATLRVKPVKIDWTPVIREVDDSLLILRNPLAYQLHEGAL